MKPSFFLAVMLPWVFLAPRSLPGAGTNLPNILWIVAEDINPNLGCYGDPDAVTPNLDRLAERSLRYRNCWSTAPVCAPARTALITGVYPSSTGSEHMRSLVKPPAFMRMYPQFLRGQGYYCVNRSKEDYNLEKPGKVWDESSKQAHYTNRPPGRPFFAAFNLNATHESQIRVRPHTFLHDPSKVRLPAYHPDAPEIRRDWAQYHDNITEMDRQAGEILRELADAGPAEDTIVFFYGDNGAGMPRCKRSACNSGLNVPLLIHVPEKFRRLAPPDYRPGGVSERLVGFTDFAPALLSLAGIRPPDWMQGHAFMGEFVAPPRRYLHGLRGRMDERYDGVRSVRNERFVHIRNRQPHLVYGQFLDYMFQTPATRVWKDLYDQGKLRPPQTAFWETKPAEELYDLQTDPDEVRNLASSSAHRAILEELRQAQREHALRIRDIGLLPEAEMHRRTAGTTPYDLGHDRGKYPLEKILATAEWASSSEPPVLPQLKNAMKDADSGVRYWAVMGCLMRGPRAAASMRDDLRSALRDESPSVRIAAAAALGRHGDGEDLGLALPVLRALADTRSNSVYVCLEALNAIQGLGGKAAPLGKTLGTMPGQTADMPPRLESCLPRLLKKLAETDESRNPE